LSALNPAVSVKVAIPPTKEALPSELEPFLNVTLPPGTEAPGREDTAACSVTGEFASTVLDGRLTIVVVTS